MYGSYVAMVIVKQVYLAIQYKLGNDNFLTAMTLIIDNTSIIVKQQLHQRNIFDNSKKLCLKNAYNLNLKTEKNMHLYISETPSLRHDI